MPPTRANPGSSLVLSALPATAYVPLPDSMPSTIIVVASWGAMRNSTVYGTATVVPIWFHDLNSLWPGTGDCISPTAISNDLLFKIAVRSDRLCILVSGLLDAFVTAFIYKERTEEATSIL